MDLSVGVLFGNHKNIVGHKGGNMAISISVLKDREILEVKYSPEAVSQKDLTEQRILVADAISKSGLKKVLVDASSLVSFPGPFTVLNHNESVAAHEILRKTKFAVVCSSLGEDERCLENTGVNRGIQMRCFSSREDALSWLSG